MQVLGMKRGILHALFCGNINPSARQIRAHSEYSRLCRELMGAENALRNVLDEDATEILECMESAHLSLDAITAEEYWTDGFQTGFRLALAVLDEDECDLQPITE